MSDHPTRQELLERARARCFFLDLGDAAARLCRANMPYGIAKIHCLQTALGMEPDACYVSTPDSTVTRNLDRWASGFGYGGAVLWSGDLVPLELKPNFCGMLVAGLQGPPDVPTLQTRVQRLAETTLPVQSIPAHWDMHRGNHFVNLYEVSDPSVTSGCRHVAIMHSSGSELRGPNPLGPGLYLSRAGPGEGLAEMASTIDTPFGTAHYLTGAPATEFLDYCRLVYSFTHARREAYARALFSDGVQILFNRMHQGLDGDHRMLLGCYHVDRSVPWVPVTLQPELPAYLVAPRAVYSRETLQDEGLWDRAQATSCTDRLTHADLLPHGGGYTYPDHDDDPVKVRHRGPASPPLFRMGDGQWFENVRPLNFAYRGDEVIRRLVDLGAGSVAATLKLVARLEG